MTPVKKGIGIRLDIALGGFAIFTGISLSRVRPNALRVAKIFFFVTLTFWLLVAASAALLAYGTYRIRERRFDRRFRCLARVPLSLAAGAEHLRVGPEAAAEVFGELS